MESLETRHLLALSNTSITPAQQTVLLDGLDELVLWAEEFQADRQSAAILPVANLGIGTLMNVADALETGLVAPLHIYFNSDATPTTDELVAVLKNLDGSFGNLGVGVVDSSVVGGLTMAGDAITFSLDYDTSRQVSTQVGLGPKGNALGITFDATANAFLTFSLNFTFGVDLTPGLESEDAWFIQVASLDLTANASVSSLTGGINLGFLDASVSSGSMTLTAGLSASLANPDADPLGRITLEELTTTDLLSLVSFSTSGSASGSVSIAVSAFGGFIPSLSPIISFTTGDPFTAPSLTLTNFSEVQPFMGVNAGSFVGILANVASWLDQTTGTSLFSDGVGIVNENLGFVLKLEQALGGGLIDKLIHAAGSPFEGLPIFDSAQSLATSLESVLNLPAGSVNPTYNNTTKQLTYTISFDYDVPVFQLPLAFDLDLSPLVELSSSTQVSFDVSTSFDFTIGLDLSDLNATLVGSAAAPANGRISADALFTLLVGGLGAVPVTLLKTATDTNASLDDLVVDLNAALATAGLAGQVVAARDTTDSARLALKTVNIGPIVSLSLLANPLGPTITELKFENGRLALETLFDDVFLENTSISAAATVSTTDIDATASFGDYVAVNIVNGTGGATLSASFDLTDPTTQTPGARVYLGELFTAVATDITTVIDGPNLAGSLDVVLPIQAVVLGLPTAGNPNITISWANLFSGAPDVAFNNLEDLFDLSHLSDEQILGALGSIGEFLLELQSFSLYDIEIPGINKSLGELFDYADRFLQKIEQFLADPNNTINDLESRLEAALGLPPSLVDIALVEDNSVLRIDLTLGDAWATQLPLHLDLGGSVGGLVDIQASALLDATAGVAFQLDFGIDLSDFENPKPFVYETTGLELSAKVHGTNINFATILGPGGAFITNGVLAIDGDGNAATPSDAVLLAAGLTDNSTSTTEGKLYFDEIDVDNFELALSGKAKATLPLYLPTPSLFQGNIEFEIGDLSDIGGTTTLTLPDLGEFFEDFDLFNNLNIVVDGVDYFLVGLRDVLNGEVFGTRLPFIGDNLGEAADFIEDVRQDVVVELQRRFAEANNKTYEVVRQGIFDALGPQGVNLLADQNGSGTVTIDDIAVVRSDLDMDGQQDDQFDFDFTLTKQLAILDEELDFDVGLAALGFEIDGEVQLGLGFTWKVGFGISRDYGFYFDTSIEDELAIGLEARIPGLHAEGRLAFLQLDVRDESATDGDAVEPSQFIAGLIVDFMDPVHDPEDPNDDDKLTFADLVSGSFEFDQLVDARLTGDARLNLDLMLSVRGDARFPSISAEFVMHWPFADTDEDLTGGEPTVAFNNVQLNLGEFISEFAAPILRTVRQVTEPFDPVIEFLTTPIPVISSFGEEITPLSIILDTARAYGYEVLADFIDAVIDIADAVNGIPLTSTSVVIPIGSFNLSGTNLKEEEDLSEAEPNVTQATNPREEAAMADENAGGFLDELAAIGIHFPLIDDPGKIFRLLMGQTVDLFLYDMPPLEFNVPFPIIKIGPIIPPYPIFFALHGSIGARLDLAFGFDTHGWELFQETGDWLDIFSGFFISDTEHPDGTGRDVLELALLGKLTGSVEASLIVASMGGGATVGIDLGADLVDTDGDGKIHLDEFLDNIERGVTCTFNLGGEIWVQATAYLEILFKRFEFTSPRFTLVDFMLTDEDCFPDRFTGNDSRASATDLGIAPGIHVEGMSLETTNDIDWYRFELLRPDSIDVNVRHSNAKGDLDLDVFDAGGNLVAAGRSQKDGEIARISNLATGVYYARVGGDSRLNNYKLIIEPGKLSDTRVFYVSNPDSHNKDDSYYTWEKGRNSNDGLTAAKPKASLQSVLDNYTLGPQDMVVFDTGVYSSAAAITAAHSGALFVGSISGSTIGALSLDGADGHWFYNLNFSSATTANLSLDAADGNRFERGEIHGAATNAMFVGSNGNHFENIHFAGPTHNVVLTASHENVFAGNEFTGAGNGVVITNTTAPPSPVAPLPGVPASPPGPGVASSLNVIAGNEIGSALVGIRIDSPLYNEVVSNTFVASGATGILLPRGITSLVTGNDVSGRAVGIYTDSKIADLYGNFVHGNTVGMESRHGIIGPNNEPPYGTPGGKASDQVYGNATGILVPSDGAGVLVRFTDVYDNDVGMEIYGDRSQIVANNIHDNQVGVMGTRIIGPENWESQLDNRIHHNAVGVRTLLGAEVRFNRIDHNGIGVEITEGSHVHHNLIVRNSGDGVLVRGPEFAGLPEDGFVQTYLVGADVINNTIFAPAGNGMRLAGFLRDVVLRNNIAMVESGSALAVHAAAQGGFSSNYNNLYATGAGRVATFFGASPIYFADQESPKSKGFADLFDWQVEGNTDLRSLGRTSLSPALDDPLFADLANDDYHLLAGSTSIDAGDPSFGMGDEPSPNGGRIDLGAYGGTAEAAASPVSWLRLTAPEFYVDLIPTETYTITWDSHNLSPGTMVGISAKREGSPITHAVATVAASTGSTTWTPSSVGIAGSLSNRWRIEIRTTSGPLLVDASREPFSVVPFVAAAANSFYVDDASNAGDEYTPAATGNNRNPGLTPESPKAAARGLLLSYPMSSGDSLYFDAGEHIHVLNLNMRRTPGSLDPLLRPASGTFVTGPTNGSVATVDRANPYPGAIAIDMRDAPGMMLERMEIRGGDYGVAVHDGSSGFTTDRTKFFRNTHDGLAIYNNSPGTWIDRVEAWENGRHGIFVESLLDHVRDTLAYDNGETGLALRGVGAAVVERSAAYCTGLSVLCQRTGIDIINPGLATAIVGHADLALSLGNKFHHNQFEGVFASGDVLVAGNTVWNNGHFGVRLDDGADATRNVVHHHVTGISALGSTSDILENRSYINTDKGIEAGFESNVLRNVTYSNEVNGIYGQRFSGLMEHNLVYATGSNSVHIEGPGKAAQFINNTVYERCSVNDTVIPDSTTMAVSWDWQTQFMPLFFFPFTAVLWGEAQFEFGDPTGEDGTTFDLGPGGFSDALTAMPVPPGQVWQIPYSIDTLELHTMAPTPLGQLSARLRAPALGTISLENVEGVLVGSTSLSLLLEFVFTGGGDGDSVLWSEPIVIGREFGPASGYNEFQALQTVIPAGQMFPPLPPTLRPPHAPPSDPPWGQWMLNDARESTMPLETPQDRGEFCPEVAVLVSNYSRDVYFRNNIIYAEGDATPGIPPAALSIDVEVRPDSIVGWDSDFNALITEHGSIGMFNGLGALDIPAWQAITGDDDYSINPPVNTVWVDPDGIDNGLAGESGVDDNFHLRSPFGHALTGALAPILDNVPGGTNLPVFEPVTFVGGPGPGDDGVSPAIDGGDPDFAFFAEGFENGKFINLGAYGNTMQSSSTETEYVNMVFPLGVEQLAAGAAYEIRWRSHSHVPGETVSIELRHDNEFGLLEWSDGVAANTGSYVWTIPAFVPFDTDYVIVVRRPSALAPGSDVIGISRRTFSIDVAGYGPTVLGTTPEAVDCKTVTTDFPSIVVTFSDNLDPASAGDATNYELREAGPSGLFDDGDDVFYAVFPTYSAGGLLADTSSVVLDLAGVALAEGHYRLRVYDTLVSYTGLRIDGDADDIAGSDYIREFAVDLTSPTFVIQPVAPSIRNTPIDQAQFEFDEAVAGFGLADVRLTRNGGPNLLGGVNSLITSADDIHWTLGNLSRLTADEGMYELTLNATDSNIRDLAGNPLLVSSTIAWQVETTAPRAVVVPVSPDPRSTGVASLAVTFSEPVYDFTLAGFEILHDESPISLSAANQPTTSDNVTWTIPNLASLLIAEGIYIVRIKASGPTHDLAGNTLARDADETWEVVVAPPVATISAVSPDPRNAALDVLTIAFDKPVVGMSLADLSLTHGGSGNLLTSSQKLTTIDHQTFTLSGLSSLTAAAGEYQLRLTALGSGILDLGDNPLAVDATRLWTTDVVAPTLVEIVDISPDPRNSPVGVIQVVFDTPVFGFDVGDLMLVRTTPSGASGNLLTSAQTLTTSDNMTWTLGGLAALTTAEGSYTLTVVAAGSQIVDAASNALTGGGSETWSVDLTPPAVNIADVSPDPRTTAVASISIVFSEAVMGIDRGDLTLRRNGAAIAISAAQTLTSSDGGVTWTLGNLGTLTMLPGAYDLSLRAFGSGVQDAAGNLLPAGTFDEWLTTIAGDFNQDGYIGPADMAILQAHLGKSGATALDGDMNGDALVNRTDAALFSRVFGRSAFVDPPGPPPAEASPQGAATIVVAAWRTLQRAAKEEQARRISGVDAAMRSLAHRDLSALDSLGKLRARRMRRIAIVESALASGPPQ